MPANALALCLQNVLTIGSALVALKLFQTGLYRRYPVFFSYFVFRVPYGLCGLLFPTNSAEYFWLFVIGSPLNWAFYVLVVRELVGLVLEQYQGLKTLGRWAMYFSLAVSVTLSVLSLLLGNTPATPQRSKGIPLLMATDRGVTFCLAIFLILMFLLVTRYPVTLGRNVVLHTSLYTAFFLSDTLSGLLKSVFGLRLYHVADTGLMAVSAACVFAWFFFLSPKGEVEPVHRPAYGPDAVQGILVYMDSLNRTLLKVSPW